MKNAMEKLLTIREKIRKIRPKFLRQDYHHRLKVQDEFWRAPKGRHSKMRQKKRGKRAIVSVGWRSPAIVRGLHRSGLEFLKITNIQDLGKYDPKKHIAILSSKIGEKKRYAIAKLALEKNIKFANFKPEEFIKKVDSRRKKQEDKKENKEKILEDK
ncbi:MAG: 50S ribosomal protein L32e, partial [Candidatus Nanoarchaeia archaeon]